jgi:hypothetical protein
VLHSVLTTRSVNPATRYCSTSPIASVEDSAIHSDVTWEPTCVNADMAAWSGGPKLNPRNSQDLWMRFFGRGGLPGINGTVVLLGFLWVIFRRVAMDGGDRHVWVSVGEPSESGGGSSPGGKQRGCRQKKREGWFWGMLPAVQVRGAASPLFLLWASGDSRGVKGRCSQLSGALRVAALARNLSSPAP